MTDLTHYTSKDTRGGRLKRPLRKNYLFVLTGISLFVVLILALSCEKDGITHNMENLPPETSIFIESRDTLNFTQSIQKLYWDGRDPDGFVVGFYYSWEEEPDSSDWIYTTGYSMTFPLELTGVDTIYQFQIKAVDDMGLADPSPACQRIPIKNSPPSIKWTLVSLIPDTTFTVATFIWSASDLDGDSTIVSFEYALEDTSTWQAVPGYLRSLTLHESDGLTAGEHAFYIRAVDIAGARSSVIRMPENDAQFWYVKRPSGRYLLIDDHDSESATFAYPDRYYRNMMNSLIVPNGENFDYWNIEALFPRSTIQFEETIKLYERIIWYTDLVDANDAHFIAAQVAIPKFLDGGGKIIFVAQFNTGFGSQGDPLAFSPVESLGTYYSRILPGGLFEAQSDLQTVFPAAPALPELKVSNFIFGVIATAAKPGSIPLYHYVDANAAENPLFVMLGRNDNSGVYDFVFSGTPLHQLNGNNNLDEFFDVILNYVFN